MSTYEELKAAYERNSRKIASLKYGIEKLGDIIAEGELEIKKLPQYSTKSKSTSRGIDRVVNKLRDLQAHSFAERCYERMGL
jgi:hypothetical protein